MGKRRRRRPSAIVHVLDVTNGRASPTIYFLPARGRLEPSLEEKANNEPSKRRALSCQTV